MKIEIWILIVVAMVTFTGNLYANGDFLIYKSKNGKETTVAKMAKDLAKKQVIFFGEFHDDADCHAVELELLQQMYAVNPKIVVSFEMFERDVQPVINDYLAGKITEKEFLEKSRPWPNYQTDYRPLVEFAKEHKLPVIAANVPRKYAGMLSRQGKEVLSQLNDTEKTYIAKKLVVLDDAYKTAFMETMQQSTAHGMPGNPVMFENMYAAQCLKDDTMAESILQAMKDFPGFKIIHYNGDFHSRNRLGTAQKLGLLAPKTKIAVIAPTYIDSQAPLSWDKGLKNIGDYLILIHKLIDQGEDIE